MSNQDAGQNTDRELWRERPDDFYSDSIHITESGGLGIKCSGTVFVKPVRKWHSLAADLVQARAELARRDELDSESLTDLAKVTEERAVLRAELSQTRAERDALLVALRKHGIHVFGDKRNGPQFAECRCCNQKWEVGQREAHAAGCLAAIDAARAKEPRA